MSDDPQGEVKMNEGFVRDAQNDGFCVVFDGPPGPESCRFVEVETLGGRSVRYGEWGQRDDGYWTLTFPAALRPSAGAGEIEALLTQEQLEDARTKANLILAGDEPSWHTKKAAELTLAFLRHIDALTAPAPGVQTEARLTENLAMLVLRLARRLEKAGLDPKHVQTAREFVTQHGLQGSVLRSDWPEATVTEGAALPAPGVREAMDKLRTVCAESYQVVGALAERAGLLNDPGVTKALDNLADPEGRPHEDVLPFLIAEGGGGGL